MANTSTNIALTFNSYYHDKKLLNSFKNLGCMLIGVTRKTENQLGGLPQYIYAYLMWEIKGIAVLDEEKKASCWVGICPRICSFMLSLLRSHTIKAIQIKENECSSYLHWLSYFSLLSLSKTRGGIPPLYLLNSIFSFIWRKKSTFYFNS